MKQPPMPMEDAGAIAVLVNYPIRNPDSPVFQELLDSIQDAEAKQIAEVLLGRRRLHDVAGNARRQLNRILAWKQQHGLLAKTADYKDHEDGATPNEHH
jgi:hypothetical protein